MKIKLMINGQQKTFDTGAQTADAVFKAAEFEEEWKKEKTSIGQLNAMAEHIAEMYGGQFTKDDIRHGLSSEELKDVLHYQCFGVGQKIAEKSKND